MQMKLGLVASLYVGKPCHYCGNPMSAIEHSRRPTKDHVIPVVENGVSGQTVMCCFQCNKAKGRMSYEQFIMMCKDIAANHTYNA